MEIILTDSVREWYEEKIPLHEGEAIRFFGKTYGTTNVHEGFSLGMQVDNPDNHDNILALTEENGRKYFTTKQDEWFFEGYDLQIDLDEELAEPNYRFISQDPNVESKEVDSTSSASKKE